MFAAIYQAMNYGKAVLKVRNKVGISQRELSSISGQSQNYISRLENGHHTPDPSSVLLIAKALGISKIIIDFYALEEKDIKYPDVFKKLKPVMTEIIEKLFNDEINQGKPINNKQSVSLKNIIK